MEKNPNLYTIYDEMGFYNQVYVPHKMEDDYFEFFLCQPNGMIHSKEDIRKLIEVATKQLELDEESIEAYNNNRHHELNADTYGDRNRNKVKKDTSGFVYFLLSETGETKIGRTKVLDDRIYHFTTKLPYDLKLISYIETDDQFALEKELHERYAHNRLRGEWFGMSDFDMNEIKEKYDLIQY